MPTTTLPLLRLAVFALLLLGVVPRCLRAQQQPLPTPIQPTLSQQTLRLPIIASASTPDAALQLVMPYLPYHPQLTWQHTATQVNSFATYYSYQPLYDGLPLYGAVVKATINQRSQQLVQLVQCSYTAQQLPLPAATPQQRPANYPQAARIQAQSFATQHQLLLDTAQSVLLVLPQQTLQMATRLIARPPKQADATEYLLHPINQQLIAQRNLSAYHHAQATTHSSSTVDASCRIFLPDPITTAEVVYGQNGKYRDQADADATELTNQLRDATIEVSFDNNVYSLKNDFIEINDFDTPNIAPAQSPTPQFHYTRSDDRFEDVNAYYHLNQFRSYVISLGFEDIVTSKLLVDPHGLDGQDQSKYIFFDNAPHVVFGDGGVDDAEDADVVVHEMGHYLSDMACNYCNAGSNERLALDEAVCDYFAASYSRQLSPYRWSDVFSWDGHNEFWAGRSTATNKQYPADVVSSIYGTSEIFSSALMDIWGSIGQQATDQLVIAAMYNWVQASTLADAAEGLMLADQNLLGGTHADSLYKYLSARGLLTYRKPQAGNDTTVCLGDELVLGGNTIVPANAVLYWSPGLSLSDSTIANPTAQPDRTTSYVLHLQNPQTELMYTDTVQVTVQYCLDQATDVIRLLNTDRFATGRGDAVVQLPANTQQAQLYLHDAWGRQVLHQTYEPATEYFFLNGSQLAAGVYVLTVHADQQKLTQKIVRTLP